MNTAITNKPELIQPGFDATLARLKAQYKAATGTYPLVSYPETFLLEQIAYESDLLTQLMNDESLQNLLAFASGERLDLLGELLDVPRLGVKSARTILRFTFAVHSQAITINQGTQVRAADNKTLFVTLQAVTVASGAPGDNSIEVSAQCTDPGSAGNGFVMGEINQIISPLPWLQSVSNISSSSTGADAEKDDNYRARLRLAPAKFTTAGSEESYIFHALSAHQNIIAVKAWSPAPNDVSICALEVGGVVPDAVMQQILLTALSDKRVRPLGDRVTIIPAVPVSQPLAVTLEFYANQASLAQSSAASAQSQLEALAQQWQRSLGQDIIPEEVTAIGQQLPGVYRATTTLAYQQLDRHQFPALGGVSVAVVINGEVGAS